MVDVKTFDGAPAIDENIFSSINEVYRSNAGAARESIAWLKGNAETLVAQRRSLTEAKMPSDMDKTFLTKRVDTRAIGRMFMYIYDPKHKKTLPYYDTLPLMILIDFTEDGFRGLNLHYVPPFVRKRILEALSKNMNKSNLTEASKIRLSYQMLKNSTNFSIIKPCYKRYLFGHVKSSFMFINPQEWNKAIMLPTEQFKKKTKTQIYQDFIKGQFGG